MQRKKRKIKKLKKKTEKKEKSKQLCHCCRKYFKKTEWAFCDNCESNKRQIVVMV